MLYKKFVIKKYRAIKEIEVPIKKDITPLIGINESGKTSILNGILAFDKTKDNSLNGNHLIYKNRYENQTEDCEIDAHVLLENEEEFNSIGSSIGLNMDSEAYKWIYKKLISKDPIIIRRICESNKLTKKYIIITDEIDNNQGEMKKLVNEIINRLPTILYFDDFSDRVPDEIIFPTTYVLDGKLKNDKFREWQDLIIEIFNRALNKELTLQDFLKLEEADDRDNYLSDVNDTLNKMIIEEWDKLKSMYKNLADEKADLQVTLIYDEHNSCFKFKIKDRENGNQRNFDISNRSKGFQWFFNFIVKLKFNPKYNDETTNAIFLLDEPGSYLHSSAQTELLRKLCEIGKENTIIYCTHSQYLLDPNVINIAEIKVISKNNGDIKIENINEGSGNESMGAFSPLYDSLRINFGFSNPKFDKCLLTEGITDYYFFKMFFSKNLNIEIIPGAGCTNLKEMISLLIPFSTSFLVILDNDDEGQKAKIKYEEFYGQSFSDNVYIYPKGKNKKFELENLLSSKDVQAIKKATNTTSIKKAIKLLYFMDISIKDSIKEGFSTETQVNIKMVEEYIKNHFGIN